MADPQASQAVLLPMQNRALSLPPLIMPPAVPGMIGGNMTNGSNNGAQVPPPVLDPSMGSMSSSSNVQQPLSSANKSASFNTRGRRLSYVSADVRAPRGPWLAATGLAPPGLHVVLPRPATPPQLSAAHCVALMLACARLRRSLPAGHPCCLCRLAMPRRLLTRSPSTPRRARSPTCPAS